MKRSYPMRLRKNGATVKIYRSADGSEFTISWIGGQGRTRAVRRLEPDALLKAEQVLDDLLQGRADRTNLSANQLAYYRACEAKLNGVSLMDAVDEYVKAHRLIVTRQTVKEAVEKFLTAKGLQGVSERHLSTLRSHLRSLAQGFYSRGVHEITAADLNDWLMIESTNTARTQHNYRISVVTFFKWCKDQGFLRADEKTAAEKTLAPVVEAKDPGILTPDAFQRVLMKADESIKPLLAIAGFTGIRMAEIARLQWSDINWPEVSIVLSRTVTKTKRRRVVPMPQNLAVWLAAFNYDPSDPIVPTGSAPLVRAAYDAAGVNPPHNCLRHSFISYMMALHQNAPMVAEICGTSQTQLQEAYKMNVTKSAAEEWFRIQP